MSKHPRAEILRAIADGKTVQILNKNISSSLWQDIDEHETLGFIWEGGSYELRIKPETTSININGREIPCPVRKPLGYMEKYWFVSFWGEALVENDTWNGAIIDHARLKRGLVHATKEAAIAHAEALLSFTRSDK